MNKITAILMLALMLATRLHAQAAADNPAMPSMMFVSTIAGDEIYAVLKADPKFATLDKEKPGSPIMIRITHIYGHTSAGTASGLASAIFAGATLGLLPAVTNKDLIMTYEVLIHGSSAISYTYSKNITRVFNIHSTDKTHGLGADGLAWVSDTAKLFSADLARDSRYGDLQAEYRFYFEPAAASSASSASVAGEHP
jgi:hypothetical protein